ncbi:MAG: hypothetical protein NTU98_08175 [Bacteroidetes bacterium]|nr:hypothetical protein [Bacteroidota bacterium]
MTISECKIIEEALKKQKIICFTDPNHWVMGNRYAYFQKNEDVLYFHKSKQAKKAKEFFNKLEIETSEIIPYGLNSSSKYSLVIVMNQKFKDYLSEAIKGGIKDSYRMSITCLFGFHKWKEDCEKCSVCGKLLSNRHNWASDCEKCSVCDKVRVEGHNWNENCEKCSICGAIRLNKHDWRHDCKRCSICGLKRNIEHSWEKNGEKCSSCTKTKSCNHIYIEDCEKCSKCGTMLLNQHDWSQNCEKCSICGTVRFERHSWQEDPEKCSICGRKRSEIHKLANNSDKLLLFNWKTSESEGKVFYQNVGNDHSIIVQKIYFGLTETYAEVDKRIVESREDSFAAFWKKFTNGRTWFTSTPHFIHDGIKDFIINSIKQIDTSTLGEKSKRYLQKWVKLLKS